MGFFVDATRCSTTAKEGRYEYLLVVQGVAHSPVLHAPFPPSAVFSYHAVMGALRLVGWGGGC